MRREVAICVVLAVSVIGTGCGDLGRGEARDLIIKDMRARDALAVNKDGKRVVGYYDTSNIKVTSIEEKSETLRVAHFEVTAKWKDPDIPPKAHPGAKAFFNLHDDGWHLKRVRVDGSGWGSWYVE